MRRITPRTCLWPLAITLSLTFALSISLTYRSSHHCYAGTCGEWLFPLQARLHVVLWYSWLCISVSLLAVRAFNLRVRTFLAKPVFESKLPLLGKHVSYSGLLIVAWIAVLYGALIGLWWGRLSTYFEQRGEEGGVHKGNARLAAVALTGHLCDVTMGMVILPISRHSALASFFKISVGTTLTFHMLTAYTLFALILTHGLLYASWLPVFLSLTTTARKVYPVLNPTYLLTETWPGLRTPLGTWRASLIFTGLVATAVFVVLGLTSLPAVRSRRFNLFYFAHLSAVLAVVLVCLHASTMLYCVAPGLGMWICDWGMRVAELWGRREGRVEGLGKGWFLITTFLPRNRLKGCACTSPLAHFYIHHAESSLRELHPFTTITHLASQNKATPASEEDIVIQFLFRKRGGVVAVVPAAEQEGVVQSGSKDVVSGETGEMGKEGEARRGCMNAIFGVVRRVKGRRRAKRSEKLQWTAKLARLSEVANENVSEVSQTDTSSSSVDTGYLEASTESTVGRLEDGRLGVPVSLRLEGPYFTPADPASFETVVCLVAGTGASGALAIAGAFREMMRGRESVEDKVMRDEGAVVCDGACQRRQDVAGSGGGGGCVVTPGTGKGKKSVWKRLVIVWSVREDDYIALPGLQNTATTPNLDIRIHLTGNGRPRLSAATVLEEILSGNERVCESESQRRGSMVSEELGSDAVGEGRRGSGAWNKRGKAIGERTWVYISGPNQFIEAGEEACKGLIEGERGRGRGLECYGARWDI